MAQLDNPYFVAAKKSLIESMNKRSTSSGVRVTVNELLIDQQLI